MRSTSSCSTCTHSTGPMPPGKSNTSGSWNARHRVPAAVRSPARDASQITGGLRHSSMVVQIENTGEDRSPVLVEHLEVRPVPGAELVDLGENRWSDAYRAKTSERPGSTPMPSSASRPASAHRCACANCSVAELEPAAGVRLVRVRRGQRHGHVEVVRTGGERALEHGEDEPRVDGVEHVGDAVLAGQRRHGRGDRRRRPRRRRSGSRRSAAGARRRRPPARRVPGRGRRRRGPRRSPARRRSGRRRSRRRRRRRRGSA